METRQTAKHLNESEVEALLFSYLKKRSELGDFSPYKSGDGEMVSEMERFYRFLQVYSREGRPFGQGEEDRVKVTSQWRAEEKKELADSFEQFMNGNVDELERTLRTLKEQYHVTMPPVERSAATKEFMMWVAEKIKEMVHPLEAVLHKHFDSSEGEKKQNEVDDMISKLMNAYAYNLVIAAVQLAQLRNQEQKERELGSKSKSRKLRVKAPVPPASNDVDILGLAEHQCYVRLIKATLQGGDVYENYCSDIESLMRDELFAETSTGQMTVPNRRKLELNRLIDSYVLTGLDKATDFRLVIMTLLNGMNPDSVGQRESAQREQIYYLRNPAILLKLSEIALKHNEEAHRLLLDKATEYGFGEGMSIVFDLARLEQMHGKHDLEINKIELQMKAKQMELEKFVLTLEVNLRQGMISQLKEDIKQVKKVPETKSKSEDGRSPVEIKKGILKRVKQELKDKQRELKSKAHEFSKVEKEGKKRLKQATKASKGKKESEQQPMPPSPKPVHTGINLSSTRLIQTKSARSLRQLDSVSSEEKLREKESVENKNVPKSPGKSPRKSLSSLSIKDSPAFKFWEQSKVSPRPGDTDLKSPKDKIVVPKKSPRQGGNETS